MNSIVGDRYIAELVQIFEQQGIGRESLYFSTVHVNTLCLYCTVSVQLQSGPPAVGSM